MSTPAEDFPNEENIPSTTREEREREQRYWRSNVRLIRNLCN
ncbi:MAG: hypothetical protein WBM86_07000 [Waterburya sp.]